MQLADIDLQVNVSAFSDSADSKAITVQCGPAGLQFNKPVFLRLRLPAPLPRGALVRVKLDSAQPGTEPVVASVSGDGTELLFAIRHFSEYSVAWGDIRNAIDSWNARGDFTDVRPNGQAEPHFVAFYDFKPSAVLNGDPLFSYKGMLDQNSRREAFKYALREVILQDRLPVTPTDQSAQAMLDSAQAFFDILDKESKAIDVARAAAKQPAIRLSAGYQKVLEAYTRELAKSGMDMTLQDAHTRLLNRLNDISKKAGLASAAGGVAINIGKDVYTALFIRSLSEEVIDSREETLRSALRGNKNVPPEVLVWLEEVIKEIDEQRANFWANVGKQLQEGAVQNTVLPLVDLVNTVGPFLSSGWEKVATKFALPIGAAIETVKTLAKIDDFGWMIGRTTAAATLVYSYLPNAPSAAEGIVPPGKALAPAVLQVRAYLLYLCYDLYAEAYRGDLLDQGVRWLIGSVQCLVGLVPSWKADRLKRLEDQRELCAEKYRAAVQLLIEPAKGGAEASKWRMEEHRLGPVLKGDKPRLAFGEDGCHIAYVSNDGGKQSVILDGKPGSQYEEVEQLVLSANGNHCAYVAKRGDGSFVFVYDGKEGATCEGIERFFLSPGGNHYAYIASRGNKEYAVIDGRQEREYDGIGPKKKDKELSQNPFIKLLWGSPPAFDLCFSPDERRAAYLARLGDREFMVVDRQEGPKFDFVGLGTVSTEGLNAEGNPCLQGSAPFSANSKRVVYVAETKGDERGHRKRMVVVDGQVSPEYDNITPVLLSPDGRHIAYGVSQRTGRRNWEEEEEGFVVLDGRPGPRCYGGIGSLLFSPDSQSLAYTYLVAKREGHWGSWVVLNGEAGLMHGEKTVRDLTFSPDSKHLAYVAEPYDPKREGSRKVSVVIDGRVGPEYEWVSGISFSQDSKHFVYVAKDENQKRFVVIDGTPGPTWKVVDAFRFSPDSNHYAYVAQDQNGLRIVVDEKPGPIYVWGNEPIFSPDSQRVAYVAVKFPTDEDSRKGLLKGVVVVDGRESAEYGDFGWPSDYKREQVRGLCFSANSKRIAYVVEYMTQNEKNQPQLTRAVVVDGLARPNCGPDPSLCPPVMPSGLCFSPDSKHVVYRDDVGWERDLGQSVVLDDQPGPRCRRIAGPVFCADGSVDYLTVRNDVLYRVKCFVSTR